MGFAMLLFFALYPVLLYRVTLGANQDGTRSFHWMLVAAPVILGAAWHFTVSASGELFVALYFGALNLFAVFLYGIWPMRCAYIRLHALACPLCNASLRAASGPCRALVSRDEEMYERQPCASQCCHPPGLRSSHLPPPHGALRRRFYLNGRWNMSNWAAAFTCSALAIGALVHHSMAGPAADLSKVVAYVAIAVAAYANIICLGHFVRDVLIHKVFTAEKQLTPLNFMKLTHEGIRCAVCHRTCAG